MTDEAGPFIGTNVGGDAGELRSLATWLGEVESVVEAAAGRLNDLIYEATEAWIGGDASFQFAIQLETGRQAAFDLSDRLSSAVSRVEGCADAIASSQQGLDRVAQRAVEGNLLVRDDRIFSPRATRPHSAQSPGEGAHLSEEAPLNEEGRERHALFDELIEEADQAMGPIADKFAEFAKKGAWFDGPIFNAGAFVAEETSLLARHESSRLARRAQHHGSLERYWSRSRGPGYIPGVHDDFARFAERHGILGDLAEQASRRFGIVAKLLGGVWATAVISGLELGFGLSGQEREGKLIVKIGTGTAVSAAGGLVAAPLIAGATLFGGFALIAVIAAAGWIVAEIAGVMYEEFVPESPRDKLMRYS